MTLTGKPDKTACSGSDAPTGYASELPKSDEMVVIGMSEWSDYWKCVSSSVDSIAREIPKIPAAQGYAKVEMLAALKSLVGIMERASMPLIVSPHNAKILP